jgi:propionate CoA-transferase
VSRFGDRIVGPGGFMNIAQGARMVVFCGTFTAKGLVISAADGALKIEREGGVPKFVADAEEVTFSGPSALARGQRVLVVTERAVFELTRDGLALRELAPGVSLERDVLPQMAFEPLITEPYRAMPANLFEAAGPRLASAVGGP